MPHVKIYSRGTHWTKGACGNDIHLLRGFFQAVSFDDINDLLSSSDHHLALFNLLVYFPDCLRHAIPLYYSNNSVLKYLSPVSGNIATITLPLFSGLLAISMAPKTLAPPDIPVNMPSSLARR